MGFQIQYNTLELFTKCGGNFSNSTDILKSPLYPDYYPILSDCIYLVTLPLGNYIKISVLHVDIDCSGITSDFIEIRDGNSDTSPLMGKFCGNDTIIPPGMTCTQNQLWIR